jgi:hypothetical protein
MMHKKCIHPGAEQIGKLLEVPYDDGLRPTVVDDNEGTNQHEQYRQISYQIDTSRNN